jgi:hypothetical protein
MNPLGKQTLRKSPSLRPRSQGAHLLLCPSSQSTAFHLAPLPLSPNMHFPYHFSHSRQPILINSARAQEEACANISVLFFGIKQTLSPPQWISQTRRRVQFGGFHGRPSYVGMKETSQFPCWIFSNPKVELFAGKINVGTWGKVVSQRHVVVARPLARLEWSSVLLKSRTKAFYGILHA